MPQLVFFALLSAAYIFWGTLQTLSIKWADVLTATDRFQDYKYGFAHPFVQAFIMFVSEGLSLVVLGVLILVKRYVRRQKIVRGDDVALPCNPIVWMLPAGADLGASILQNMGLMLTYASVYQMLRGAVLLFVGLLSRIWLGRRFTRVECVGMFIVAVGLTLVGLSSVLGRFSSGTSNANRSPFLGSVLIVLAQVLHAYQGVCEERLVKLYRVPPLQMVGTEGFYGVGMILMLLAVFQLFPFSPFQHNIVGPIDSDTQHNMEHARVPFDDVILAFDQMWLSRSCLLSMLAYILGGFFYNTCQMTIIRHFSATNCVMVGSLRNIAVWVVALSLSRIFDEHFNVVELAGFLFLVAGNVVFQNVIPDHWWHKCYEVVLGQREGQGEHERTEDVLEVAQEGDVLSPHTIRHAANA
ncbi:putative solute carrier family 35 member F6-like isoform X1 [Trypanosoma rangeli]|uniref:Putative solute carrier family 35 member F6-like isoform X1 n=1 Tax=Trypanosoma rangeli TaxID=5698 RepID=A0A3R7N2L5_TRYRA|nr:putative solute carrier family 35 member F6-like isoform X1 [Trypanosoma rangeli]RNF11821.1 putative solute carrier family 35 member F6-like isoform X1 [Trypanosoma rangeli]|eukprot:RNF11821.1 putative solute carrier family 35 member F6-like isoform X1 [Trypanosoma rangeli]